MKTFQSAKMLSLEADDIYHIVEPFHVISKLIGITSFSVERKGNAFVAKNTCANILCILTSTFLSLAMCAAIVFHKNRISEVTAYGELNSFEEAVFFVMLGFFSITISCNWWIFFSQKRVCKLLTILKDVDMRLQEICVPINLRKHKKVAIALMMILEAFLVLIASITYTVEIVAGILEPSVAIFISMCFIVKLGMMTVFQFIFLAWLVKLRFERINYYLEEKFASLKGVATGNENLSKIASLHDELVDATNEINYCFSYPVWNFFNFYFKLN